MNNPLSNLPPGGTVHLQFVKISKTPACPEGEEVRCENCVKWLHGEKQRVAIVQGGGKVAISQLIASGMKTPPADHVVTLAACTFTPIWSETTHDHWCWNFGRPLSA
jgi:hypothetical protein